LVDGIVSYLDVLGELLESLDDLGNGEDSDLVGELGLVVLDLGLDGEGKARLDLLDLDQLGEDVLVGDEDLDDLSSGLLGLGGQLGNSGASLIGVIAYLDVLDETVDLVDVVDGRLGHSEVVEGRDSELVGELLLVGHDLSEHFGGESLLEGQDLVVLLTWSLVGDEDLDDVSSGLLGSGRELEHAGLSLLGVSLQISYLDVLGEDLESGDDLLKSKNANLVGELSLVVLNLGLHGSGKMLLDLLDLDDLGEVILVRAEDLDDLSSGLLGGLRQLGDSGASLLGTVELVDVVIVGVGVGEVVEGSDSERKGLADLLDLGVLLLGGLVGAEDLDDLSGGLLGGLRQLGDSGASLLGVCLQGKVTYPDMSRELLESLNDLIKGEESDLVSQISLVVVDLSPHGGGQTGLDLLAFLVLLLGGLVRDEDLDDLSGGLLRSGGQLGDSGAGLFRLLESLDDLSNGEDSDLVGELGLELKVVYLDMLSQTVQLGDVVIVRGSVSHVMEGHDANLLRDLLLDGVDLSEDVRGQRISDVSALLELLLGTSEGSESLIFLHSSNFSWGVLSETKILTISPAGFWAAYESLPMRARASSGCSYRYFSLQIIIDRKTAYLDVLSELVESLDDLGKGKNPNLVSEISLVVVDLSPHGSRETSLDLLALLILLLGSLVGDEDLDQVSSWFLCRR
ncbi:hypothetical protein PMAYCL1PPCAC_01886, partial [Pristionchus mayeri]